MKPTVIIGIGGVGKEILMRVRRMIVEKYGSLANVPQLRFLHIDTHDQINAIHTGQAVMGERIGFDDTERIQLTVTQQDMGLLDDPNVQRWFPDPSAANLSAHNFATGAGGKRSYGRFAFHCNVNRFTDALSQKALIAHERGNHLNVTIVIACSFFGGTGSGAFLDVCYNIRKMQKLLDFKEVMGFFVIGGDKIGSDPVNGEAQKANCYAALKELEYFMTCGKKDKPGFLVDYPGTRPNTGIVNDRNMPVDACFLIDWQNKAEYHFSREQLEENVARRIFLECHEEIAEHIQGKRADIRKQTPNFDGTDETLDRAQAFLAFGLSVCEFPAMLISETLGCQLAKDCVTTWLFEDAPPAQNVADDIKRFIENLDRTLMNDLQKGTILAVNSVTEEITSRQRLVTAEIDKKPFSSQSVKNAIEDSQAHFDRNLQDDPNPQQRGIFVKTIEANREVIFNNWRTRISQQISTIVTDSFRGVKFANDYLAALHIEIEKRKGEFSRQQEHYSKERQNALLERSQKYGYLCEDLFERYRKDLHRHVTGWFADTQIAVLHGIKASAYANGVRFFDSFETELERLQKELKSFTETLKTWRIEFEQTEKSRRNQLLVRDDGRLTIDENFLKNADREQIPNRRETISTILNEIETEVDMGLLMAVITAPGRVKLAVEKRCVAQYNALRKTSILTELARRSEKKDAVDEIIAQQVRRSEAMLRVQLKDSTIAYLPGTSHKKFMFLPCPPKNDQADQQPIPIPPQPFQTPVGYEPWRVLPEQYQIIFAEEFGGFPLRNLTWLSSYRTSYLTISKATSLLQTDKRIEFPDIFPPDGRLVFIRERAHRARVIGIVLEVLTSRQNADGDQIYILRHSEGLIEKLDPSIPIEQQLFEEQQMKEVEGEIHGETKLEMLENEIVKIAKNAKTPRQKGELWQKTEEYRQQLLEMQDPDIGDEADQYQDEWKIIWAFRKEYKLQPSE